MDRKVAYITISVDDGHPTDLRTADLLEELDLRATFYIPAADATLPILSNVQIRRLADRFEVGAHTFHHVALTRLRREDSRREIVDGKAWLEDVTERPVRAFCYPRGKFNSHIVRLVEEAGFEGARTCMQNLLGPPRNPFTWGASTQAFSHTRRIQVRHAALERNWAGLANFIRIFRGAVDWEAHFNRAVGYVASHGGIAHLYLHSWEIDRQDSWEKLRRVLVGVSDRYPLVPVTNGELFNQAGPL
jgi:peptidoglycan/xylan/chitin deacetylase (PgdA/CDA1 family)